MENEVKRAVGGAVAVEHDPDGIAETKGQWVAPKLRKVDIAEVTAHGDFLSVDGPTSS